MPTTEQLEQKADMRNIEDFDIDKDGSVSDDDLKRSDKINAIEIREQKALTQKRMAWTALIGMLILTAVLFSPIVGDSRVSALADLLGLFYIAQAGIVGAYMGVTAWMSKS